MSVRNSVRNSSETRPEKRPKQGVRNSVRRYIEIRTQRPKRTRVFRTARCGLSVLALADARRTV